MMRSLFSILLPITILSSYRIIGIKSLHFGVLKKEILTESKNSCCILAPFLSDAVEAKAEFKFKVLYLELGMIQLTMLERIYKPH